MPKHPSNKYRNICKRKSKLQEDKRELTRTILETTRVVCTNHAECSTFNPYNQKLSYPLPHF